MTQITSFTTGCRSALSSGWTRREFLRGAGAVAALGPLSLSTGSPRFAYVACGDNSLRVFSMRGKRWTLLQRVPSFAPACVLLAAAQQALYVANEIDEHDGLPRGTVEVFHVDPEGRLSLSNRIALSLSATRPRHMAISPDGKFLAVAAYGGGIYNVIAITEDGGLGKVISIFKETGCGPHALQSSAHPHNLCFDAVSGHLLSSDFGSDRLNLFAVDEGSLRRCMQRSTGEGSGPSQCVFHPSGSFIYAWHGLEKMLVCYRYKGGTLGEVIQRVPLSAGGLAMHPSGRMLYSSQEAWRIDTDGGTLSRVRQSLAGGNEIVVSHDGTRVYILDGLRGLITEASVESATGEVHCKTNVAVVARPRSIALKTI